MRQIPPFVTYGDIFPPERGKSSLKGGALGKKINFSFSHKKAPPFGGAGNAARH